MPLWVFGKACLPSHRRIYSEFHKYHTCPVSLDSLKNERFHVVTKNERISTHSLTVIKNNNQAWWSMCVTEMPKSNDWESPKPAWASEWVQGQSGKLSKISSQTNQPTNQQTRKQTQQRWGCGWVEESFLVQTWVLQNPEKKHFINTRRVVTGS